MALLGINAVNSVFGDRPANGIVSIKQRRPEIRAGVGIGGAGI